MSIWMPARRTIYIFYAVKVIWITNKPKLMFIYRKNPEDWTVCEKITEFILKDEKFVFSVWIVLYVVFVVCFFFLGQDSTAGWAVWNYNLSKAEYGISRLLQEIFEAFDCMCAFSLLWVVKNYPGGFKVSQEVNF